MTEQKKLKVGVIIGRFQVHALHAGHKALIKKVKSLSDQTLILIGSTPSVNLTKRQPLNYETRRALFNDFASVVLPILDNPTNEGWSANVDSTIKKAFTSSLCEFTLYGSRDSFIPHYKGKYPTVEIEPVSDARGTETREKIKTEIKNSPDFRRGIIYASQNRYPIMFCTCDIIIRNSFNSHILLGRKKNDPIGKWRFPGGFLDPTKDKSFLDAAKREADEEVSGLVYQESSWKHCGSLLVDDWRYRRECDKIMTTVFTARATSLGLPQAGDDLNMVQWFEPSQLPEILIHEHKPIWTMFGKDY